MNSSFFHHGIQACYEKHENERVVSKSAIKILNPNIWTNCAGEMHKILSRLGLPVKSVLEVLNSDAMYEFCNITILLNVQVIRWFFVVMSGKTFYFRTDNLGIFDFFQRCIWREKETGQEKFGKLKFCLVQNVFENCGRNMFVQGIIQFTSRLSEKKARLYFLEKGVTAINPEGIKMHMAIILAAMRLYEDKHYVEKTEWGQLSLGGGFRDYKRILNESFNAYYDLKAKRI